MLYLMNCTVIPHGADGVWQMGTVSADRAAVIAAEALIRGQLMSAVGHQSSADAMAAVLDVPVQMNRITVEPVPGDRFLCLRLLSRAPEGVILDREQLEEIGYSWALLSYESAPAPSLPLPVQEIMAEIRAAAEACRSCADEGSWLLESAAAAAPAEAFLMIHSATVSCESDSGWEVDRLRRRIAEQVSICTVRA
jgi:hypothetical protein